MWIKVGEYGEVVGLLYRIVSARRVEARSAAHFTGYDSGA